MEGYFDAIMAYQKGFKNTIASLGTALTEGQLRLLKRYASKIFFAFDADLAGISATKRSTEIAQKLDFEIRLIQISEGKDPDECLRKGTKKWEEALQKAENLMDYYFRITFAEHDKEEAFGKKKILEELLPVIQRFPNAVEREHFLQKLAQELKTTLKSIYEENRKLDGHKHRPIRSSGPAPKKTTKFSRPQHLLALLFNFPQRQKLVEEGLKLEWFPENEEKRLYKSFLKHHNKKEEVDLEKLISEATPKEDLELFLLLGEERYSRFALPDLKKEVEKLIQEINHDHKKKLLASLYLQIREKEQEKNKEAYISLLKKYNHLLKEDSS